MKKITFILLITASMIISMSSCLNKKNNEIMYLPVQLTGSERWSILELKTGELVCKDEFKERPSEIIDGLFYVKNESTDYYDFYNINDIRKPINSDKYVAVTKFYNGVAFAVKDGECISLIDENCKVIKQLDKDIQTCYNFSEGLAIYKDNNDKFGFINEKGKIVVKAKYDWAQSFSNGVAMCEVIDKENNINKVYAVDISGKELFSFNTKEYKAYSEFSDGYLPVLREKEILFLDKNGNKKYTLCQFEDESDAFLALYKCVFNGDQFIFVEGEFCGLKDKNNEVILRAKYDYLKSIGEGLFIAEKEDKFGVIDHNDNVILDFDYDDINYIKKGLYMVEKDDKYALVDKKGKDVSKNNFESVGGTYSGLVISNYIDAKEFAKKIKNYFTSETFESDTTYSKDLTVKDFLSYLTGPTSTYEDVYTIKISNDEIIFFRNPIAKETYEYFYGFRIFSGLTFNYYSPIAGVIKAFDLSTFPITTEKKVAEAFDSLLENDGYTKLDGEDNIYQSGKGTYVSLTYENGVVNVLYCFSDFIAKGITSNRTDRKTKKAEKDEEDAEIIL